MLPQKQAISIFFFFVGGGAKSRAAEFFALPSYDWRARAMWVPGPKLLGVEAFIFQMMKLITACASART
jgi:hypothetical protein